jgi:hypothetical protein
MRAVPLFAATLFTTTFSLASGCVALDLGDSPFLCNLGAKPQCPSGYHCSETAGRSVCLRDDISAEIDAGISEDLWVTNDSSDLGDPNHDGPTEPTDDGNVPDTLSPDQGPTYPDGLIQSGALHISEVLINPQAIFDAKGEYLELYNPGNTAIDINGWTLRDNSSDAHTIVSSGPVLVPAKGYVVIGKVVDQVDNGNVNVAYAYGSQFSMANSGDEVLLVDPSGKIVDQFSYGSSFVDAGSAASVIDFSANKNDPSNWCLETFAWSGSSGDKGSPGTARGCN